MAVAPEGSARLASGNVPLPWALSLAANAVGVPVQGGLLFQYTAQYIQQRAQTRHLARRDICGADVYFPLDGPRSDVVPTIKGIPTGPVPLCDPNRAEACHPNHEHWIGRQPIVDRHTLNFGKDLHFYGFSAPAPELDCLESFGPETRYPLFTFVATVPMS